MSESSAAPDMDENPSPSEQFNNTSFSLKWLSLRRKKVETAIRYEKNRKSKPFIEDSDAIRKKISEIKKELEEVKNIKIIKDKRHIDGHCCNILRSIVGPKDIYKKSRYSVEQVKCMKDIVLKKKMLERQRSHNQKEILALAEQIETVKDNVNETMNKKNNHEDYTKAGYENLDEITKCQFHSRKLADRSKLLANIMHRLTEYYLSKEDSPNKEKLQPVIDACKLVLESPLEDPKEIHSLLFTIHGVKI